MGEKHKENREQRDNGEREVRDRDREAEKAIDGERWRDIGKGKGDTDRERIVRNV